MSVAFEKAEVGLLCGDDEREEKSGERNSRKTREKCKEEYIQIYYVNDAYDDLLL